MKRKDSVKRLPRKKKKQQQKQQEKNILQQLAQQPMMAKSGGRTKDGDTSPSPGDNKPEQPPVA